MNKNDMMGLFADLMMWRCVRFMPRIFLDCVILANGTILWRNFMKIIFSFSWIGW